jgi:hypothetical protein
MNTNKDIRLLVKPEEVPILQFALEQALHSISEKRTPDDRACLKALMERLEAAQEKGRQR